MTTPTFLIDDFLILGYPAYHPIAAIQESAIPYDRMTSFIAFDFEYGAFVKNQKIIPKNILSPSQMRSDNNYLEKNYPGVFRSVDCEGEDPFLPPVQNRRGINRLKASYGFPETLCAQAIGKLIENRDINTAKDEINKIADMLLDANFNLVYAPVLDVDRNPNCPIIGKLSRSYHRDPHIVAEAAHLFIQACRVRNILCVSKHFPGHGSSTVDSHLGCVDISSTWAPIEYLPYQLLSTEIDAVMLAHVTLDSVDPLWPAALSQKHAAWLRKHINPEALLIADDLQMAGVIDFLREHYKKELQNLNSETEIIFLQTKGALHALQAGMDCLIFGGQLEAITPKLYQALHLEITQALQTGELCASQLEQSYKRIQRMKQRFGLQAISSC